MGKSNGAIYVDALFAASVTKVELWNHAVQIIRKQERDLSLIVNVTDISRAGPYWVVELWYRHGAEIIKRRLYVAQWLVQAA